MRELNIGNIVRLSNLIINDFIKEGDIALDCTVGNGHDTKLLAEQVGDKGKVYGFDIQEAAIVKTRELLIQFNLERRVELFKDSHDQLDKYIKEQVNIIVYNLGYLPGSDKKIITKKETTIKSLKKSLDLLAVQGIILIASYIGHPGGRDENIGIENLLSELDQKKYNVLKSEFINQKNKPPILYIIKRLK